MNITLDKSLKTDSKQPKIYNLGNVVTTVQDLLDSSKIIINGEQTIILSINNNDIIYNYLLPIDYNGDTFYGFGKNISESDLISISGNITYNSLLLNSLISQSGTDAPILNILTNSFIDGITTEYVSTGTYYIDTVNGFIRDKTHVFLESYITPGLNKVDIYKTITLSGRLLIQVFVDNVLADGYLNNSSLKIETF